MGPSFLFVCFGNICRSPMAVGIARKVLGNGVRAESAGIAAGKGAAASGEAVLLLKAVYGADISAHRSRDFGAVDASSFDYVIAMDLYVYGRIKGARTVPEDRLFGWDVEDPLGLGYDAYKRAAKKIESRLRQFLDNQGL
jgi:protein-tyrosine-phosphatase